VLAPERVDLNELLNAVVQAVRSTAQDKGLALTCQVTGALPAAVRVDRVRLSQVLFNLLGNALKFTARGEVALAVHALAADELSGRVTLRFSVRDTGIGIAPEKIRQVFDAFTQADASTSRVYGGTGLGLSISRRLVGLMGGRLQASSEVGVGSTFWFDLALPVTPAQEVAEQTAWPPGASASSEVAERVSVGGPATSAASAETDSVARGTSPSVLDVLVVDDVPANRLLMGTKLERAGHRVAFAQHGAEALLKMDQQPFDLVFMDMQMPVMDGLMATQRIRQSEAQTGRSPALIVALTANVMPADEQRCLDAGMSGYMSKPFGRDLLAHWIAQAQQRKASGPSATSQTGGA
jgi:CheY-like chemotaxis protein